MDDKLPTKTAKITLLKNLYVAIEYYITRPIMHGKNFTGMDDQIFIKYFTISVLIQRACQWSFPVACITWIVYWP